MDRAVEITLIKTTREQDNKGVWRPTEERRTILCYVNSVTRSEFFEGGRNGLNPEYRFTVFFGDYQGEETLVYNGLAYGIYRTYHADGDNLELYAERKGGTNGNSEQ